MEIEKKQKQDIIDSIEETLDKGIDLTALELNQLSNSKINFN